MIYAKICMLGAASVGKTSLVSRFVHSIFSEKYLTSVGVKIDNRVIRIGHQEVTLVIWDLYGDDEFQQLRSSYLRGSSGFLLVADGTRRETLDTALRLVSLEPVHANTPCIVALNKVDLFSDWDHTPADQEALTARGFATFRTSAKTGDNVEAAFLALARHCLPASKVRDPG